MYSVTIKIEHPEYGWLERTYKTNDPYKSLNYDNYVESMVDVLKDSVNYSF